MKKHNILNKMYSRILIPVISVIILQGILLLAILLFGSPKRILHNSSIDNFKSNVNLRKNYLEVSMSNKWDNLEYEKNEIINNTSDFLKKNNITISDLLNTKDYSEELLNTQADIISNIIIKNHVSTSFLIIDNQGLEDNDKMAVFLNTKNPDNQNGENIEVLFAPKDTLYYYYKKGFIISTIAENTKFKDIQSKEFYDKPVDFVKNNKGKEVGYWSSDLSLDNYNYLTYTIPLILDGNIFGVLGIGLSDQYLEATMSLLNKGANLNIELVRKNDNGFESVFKSYIDHSINYSNVNEYYYTDDSIYSFKNGEIDEYLCCEYLNIYSDNFYGEYWYILGISPKNEILAVSNLIEKQISLIYLMEVFVTIIILFVITRFITKPIKRVSKSVNENNIYNIPKTNIYEVDVLLDELSLFFDKALVLNRKLDSVIEDTNLRIAILEYSKADNLITTTHKFYSMLGVSFDETSISIEEFLKIIGKFEGNIINNLYKYNDFLNELFLKSNQYGLLINDNYLRLKIVVSQDGAIATLLDLTSEYNEKTKIEKERDYDLLTGLLNRTGLYLRVDKIFQREDINGALYMIDVDNLKKINDKYGHQVGDEYITKVGSYLKELAYKFPNLITSHISGDEFILYLDEPKDNEVWDVAKELEKIKDIYLDCYSGRIYISISCGIALYEKNISFEELRKRADFAMYTVKNNTKNSIALFNSDAYSLYKMENLMHEKLIKLINERKINYAYQPIVDVNTGEIYGYEALMRPLIEEYKSPLKVIEEAKKYNRLYDIECLTLFLATKKFTDSNSNKKLFINSVPSQILSDDLWDKYLSCFKDNLKNIIVEIIEEDFGGNQIMTKKIEIIKNNNMNYAIDDYGTGFNSISMILDYSPMFIKLEGSLIRGIDNDEKKKQFSKSLVNFCKENNILVIAESVETIQELKCVKEIGVQYVQGYFVSKPDLEIKDISDELKRIIREA